MSFSNPYYYFIQPQNSAINYPQFYSYDQEYQQHLRNGTAFDYLMNKNMKNLFIQPHSFGSKERRIDNSENGQVMNSMLGNVKQKQASYDDHLSKTKKANKDISKKQGLDSKKPSQNGVIVIEDDDDNDQVAQNIQMQTNHIESDSSSVEVIEKPQIEKQRQKNLDKSNNTQSQNILKQSTERVFGAQPAVNANIVSKITSYDQPSKSEPAPSSNKNNFNKTTTSQSTQYSRQINESKTNIPKQQLIILSDNEDDDQEFKISQPKEIYCYQNNSNKNNSSINNSANNIGQCAQYQKLFQTSQKNIKSIPVCDFSEDLTILKVQNPHKLHINDQFRATQIKLNSFDLQKLNHNQFSSKLEKIKWKDHLKQTKSSSTYPQKSSNQNINLNMQKSSKLNDLCLASQNFTHALQNQNSNNSVSSSSSKAFYNSQNNKNYQNQKLIDVQSPSQTNSSQQEEKDKNKKFINSKYLYCKKCDKQIEFSNIRKSSEGKQLLCKACHQTKQKIDQQNQRYWEQVFRNTEDRQNKTEVGIEYQAVIPEHSMVNLQQWQQQNKAKFQAILANKVHNAEDNGVYTEVINLIRQKYNENYSHNDFLSLMKNTKLTLNEIKDKMENDEQNFLNQIEACSSNTCKNQRVTRLTKRRLEYLQNY